MRITQNDINRSRSAADDAAKYVLSRYTTFILVSVYLGITIGSTTDEQLLRESSLALPLLSVSLPIVPFYAVMPGLYMLLHGNLLLQLSLLSGKLGDLDRLIATLPAEDQTKQRRQVYPFPYSYVRLKTAQRRWVSETLAVSVWTTMIVLPVMLLCWTQRQFLPFHHGGVTWCHRMYVLADLVLLWSYWHIILPTTSQTKNKEPSAPTIGRFAAVKEQLSRALKTLGSALRWAPASGGTAVVVCFSLFAGTIPGERIDRVVARWKALYSLLHDPTDPDAFFNKVIHRNLDVKGKTLVAQSPPRDLLAARVWGQQGLEEVRLEYTIGIDLRERDLRFADFRGCHLIGAKLQGSDLEGALLADADLRKAEFVDMLEPDANRKLDPTNLASCDLRGAHLEGVDLSGARLDGANLDGAHLRGAFLNEASLHGASLKAADLRKCELKEAKLLLADMTSANLRGAVLTQAWLLGVDLSGAKLQGAKLTLAKLYGAEVTKLQLLSSILDSTKIEMGAFPCLANLNRKDLSDDDWDDVSRIIVGDLVGGPERTREALRRLDRARGPNSLQCRLKKQMVEWCDESVACNAFPWPKYSCKDMRVSQFVEFGCTFPLVGRRLIETSTQWLGNRAGSVKGELGLKLAHVLEKRRGTGVCKGLRNAPEKLIRALKKALRKYEAQAKGT